VACDSVTCITLEHLACNADLVPRVYRPLAKSKGNHGDPRFEEECEVEATVRRPVVIQERERERERETAVSRKHKSCPRNDNPSNVVQLTLE